MPISGIIDYYCIMENLKKSGENKNKLRTIYTKNHKNFKIFFQKKKECSRQGKAYILLISKGRKSETAMNHKNKT